MKNGDKIKIKKDEFPKPRRKWKRKPITQVKESGKKYKRQKFKRNTRKVILNGKDK